MCGNKYRVFSGKFGVFFCCSYDSVENWVVSCFHNPKSRWTRSLGLGLGLGLGLDLGAYDDNN